MSSQIVASTQKISRVEPLINANMLSCARHKTKERMVAPLIKHKNIWLTIAVAAVVVVLVIATLTANHKQNLMPAHMFEGQFAYPCSGAILTLFGGISDGFHLGIDIGGPVGDPVCAAEAGTVITAGPYDDYGNLIVVDHGYGIETYYAYLSAFAVSVGDLVEKGETIGYIGIISQTKTPHVHFEVRCEDECQDPLVYLVNTATT